MLIAALLIVVIFGSAFALFGLGGSTSSVNTASSATNTASTQGQTTAQANATATEAATATDMPQPTATNTPRPTATNTSVPPTATPVPIISSGTTTIPGTLYFDFDAGALTQNGADVRWDIIDETTNPPMRQMLIQNGAGLINLGVGTYNFNNISKSQLQTYPYGGSLPGSYLGNGDVFAVRTSDGHYAKVLVLSYGHDIQIQWVTY